MASLKFVDQHNMVACLEKSEENTEFHQIVDFLSTCSINYALTICLTINASYIEQFLNTATSKPVNSVKQIHTLGTLLETLMGVTGIRFIPHMIVLFQGFTHLKKAGLTGSVSHSISLTGIERKVGKKRSVQRLSMKKRLGRKESVSKQGRKNAKPEPTLDAFNDLDADGRDYIETEDVVKEGRQSNETEELNKGSGEKGGSTKELVSTIVPKIVSTARPELSTARPDVDVARQEDSAVEPKTPPTTTSIFDDEDIPMAQTLIKNRQIVTGRLASRGIDADALFAAKLQQEEREEYTIKERAKPWDLDDVVKDSKEVASVNKQEVLKEPNSTKVEVKQEGHEESIKKRPGRRLKMKSNKESNKIKD
ncbi:hypothetical protein Tco_0898835 [Tanacetum coccineum]